jgi:DNA invertase Pin-like site-specific DNA recombinase
VTPHPSGKIRSHHLARKAVPYLRQSTEQQVRENTGSTDYQRGLARLAVEMGWPEALVEVNDTDLGLSGAAADHRPGYQGLVQEIRQDLVGAIFLSDFTRGGRHATEWYRLLDLCRDHDVLIINDGVVVDPRDDADLMLARIQVTLGEGDNVMRRKTLERGRLARLAQRRAVSVPPAGYVPRPGGSWEKDPDPRVQAAIETVLSAFLEFGTCARAVRALHEQGVLLPRRKGAYVEWVKPQLGTVYWMLKHPAYKGDYAYRRHTGDPRRGRDGRGYLRQRKARPEEICTVSDHHPPYVSPAVWEAIQARLALNAPSKSRRNLGPGPAVCQGIIRCHPHRSRAMQVSYRAQREGQPPSYDYFCRGDYDFGGTQCGHVFGPRIDAVVLQAVQERLAPPELAVLQRAVRDAAAGEALAVHRLKLELNAAELQVTRLERLLSNVDPENVETVKALSCQFESATQRTSILARQLDRERARAAAVSDADLNELVDLCRDLAALWTHMTNEERKQLLRLLIERVLVAHRDREHIRLRIDWSDGGPALHVALPLPGLALRLVQELRAAGLEPASIAERLNGLGVYTMRGRPWTQHAIAHKLRTLSRKVARGGHAEAE